MSDPSRPGSVLLDTCAIIWLVNAESLSTRTTELIGHAAKTDGVFVSTASAWEVGLLSRVRPGRRLGPEFHPDPKTWFARVMALPGIKEAPITAAIAIAASHLPGELHADPADRLIIATARHRGMPIVTSDRKILAYADSGYVKVIPC